MNITSQCNAQKQGSKATILKLPVLDLPDFLIVSSRIVNQKYIDDNSPDASSVLYLTNDYVANKHKPPVNSPAIPLSNEQDDATVADGKISCGTMTDDDGLPPTRERFTQTTENNVCHIGVQCNMEICDWEDTQPLDNCETIKKDEAKALKRQKFNEFVEEKTFTFPNGSRECLICGEITVKNQDLQAHMTIHWGPSVLCYRCGVQFEHRQLMRSHACTEEPGKGRRRYACPHYKCNVVAISPLELYDHINEHTKEQHYICAGCWHTFTTVSELRAHCNMMTKCQRAMQPKRFSYWGLQSKADRTVRKRIILRRNAKKKVVIQKAPLKVNRKSAHYRQCSLCRMQVFSGSSIIKHIRCCTHNHRKQMQRTDK